MDLLPYSQAIVDVKTTMSEQDIKFSNISSFMGFEVRADRISPKTWAAICLYLHKEEFRPETQQEASYYNQLIKDLFEELHSRFGMVLDECDISTLPDTERPIDKNSRSVRRNTRKTELASETTESFSLKLLFESLKSGHIVIDKNDIGFRKTFDSFINKGNVFTQGEVSDTSSLIGELTRRIDFFSFTAEPKEKAFFYGAIMKDLQELAISLSRMTKEIDNTPQEVRDFTSQQLEDELESFSI